MIDDQEFYEEPSFFVSRLIHAPREIVWRAWTDPKLLAKWWGPNYFTNPVCAIDARRGGSYRIIMRGPDGVDYPMRGVYQDVERPEKIVMTMDVSEHPEEWHEMVNPTRGQAIASSVGEMVTTVTLEEDEDRTQLSVSVLFESREIRDSMVKMGMPQGWAQSLDRLAELVRD